MTVARKRYPVVITSTKGKTIRAIISTWDNVDWQGDRMIRGAFLNSINEWMLSGDPIPWIWSHDHANPMAHLGVVRSIQETDRGLLVEAEITDDNEFARQVQKLLAERRVTKFSFAFDIVHERTGSDGARELVEVKLLECGPCLLPANEETELLSVKSVQQMLAREASGGRTWAGTTVPQKSVDDLRDKMSGLVEGFLDEIWDAAESKETTMTRTNPELARYNAEIDAITGETPNTDDDLRKQIEELEKVLVISADYAGVLTRASALLAQVSARAQAAGLPDAVDTLQGAARDLRTIASGGEGDVAAVIAVCRPLVAELRAVNPVAGASLERTLAELAGGVAVEYVDNADRVEGSVGVTDDVTDDRDRYKPKSRDDHLRAKLEELSPAPKPKPGGSWTYDVPQLFIPDEETS